MADNISRRSFMRQVAGGLSVAAFSGCELGGQFMSGRSKKHPNLVFVFPDQMCGQAM